MKIPDERDENHMKNHRNMRVTIRSSEDVQDAIGPDPKFETYRKTTTIEAVEAPWDFAIHTREGRLFGRKGDYIAIGVRGEIYPIGRAIFQETYVRTSTSRGTIAAAALANLARKGSRRILRSQGWSDEEIDEAFRKGDPE